MADGTIKIDTSINLDGIEVGTSKLRAAMVRAAKSLTGLGATGKKAADKVSSSMKKAEQDISRLNEEPVPARQFSELGGKIEDTEKKLQNLQKAQELFLQSGGDPNSTWFSASARDIENYQRKLSQLRNELLSSNVNTQAVPGTLPDAGQIGGFERVRAAFGKIEAAAARYKADVASASSSTKFFESSLRGLAAAIHAPVSGFQRLRAAISNMPAAIIETQVSLMRKSLASLTGVLKRLEQQAKRVALRLLELTAKGIVGKLKKISSGILDVGKSAERAHSSIGSMLGTSILFSFVFQAINGVMNAAVEGMNNLAQYSDETNATLSRLMSSLTQLKNAFATAFSPILTAIAPALNYLINLLSAAATAVAHLIAALTGKSTFVKATKVQQDYAASLEETGSAASSAGKDAKKSLAPFDDLVQIQQQGADAGGGGGAELSPGEMFETVPVESAFKNFANQLKGFIVGEDWVGLGGFIADGLNAGFQKIYDVISWDRIGPTVTYFVTAFSESFNSLVDSLDWDLLGSTVGVGVNSVVNTLNLLVDRIDWLGMGTGLAEGMNGLIDEIDWENLGKLIMAKFNIVVETILGFAKEFDWGEFGRAIGAGINGAVQSIDPLAWADAASTLVIGFFDSITETLNNVDWQRIGNRIATFFANIDYSGIATSLFTGLGAALASLAEFLWGLIEQAWDSVVGWWRENAYEDGKFTIEGLLQGIADIMANIGTWIVEHIFNPFINGFKEAFGIHSPSTVMMELAGDLMNGLLLGIQNFIPSLISKFSQIKTQILQKWDEVKKGTKEKWNSIKSSLSTTWSTIKTAAGTKFEEVRQTVLAAWENIKENASQKWSEIQTNLGAAWENLKDTAGRTFTDLKDGIVEAWENLKKKTSDLWGDNGISGIIKGIINGIVLEIEGMVNHIIDCLNWIINQVNKLSIEVPDTPLTDGFTIGFDLSTLDHISLPRLASGTVIPPRAGEFAAILGDNNREAEVVSPVSAIKQALLEAMQEAGGTGSQTITLRFDGSMSALARVLKPELDREAARRGTKLVTVGGR